MSCIDCEEKPIRGAYYRWKNANVEIIACEKHWREIREVLSEAQSEKATPPQEAEEWWDEFIFTFVSLKEKQQVEHGGEYVSPYTAGNIKKFIEKLLQEQKKKVVEDIKTNVNRILSGGEITLDMGKRQKKLTDYFDALKENL
jgi:hypothetical protein